MPQPPGLPELILQLPETTSQPQMSPRHGERQRAA